MVQHDDGRRTADERRESILRAAAQVFGRRGYAGATTDQVARAAGISQPYVVRLFGSKEALFLAVLDQAKTELLAAFRAAIAEDRASDSPAEHLFVVLGDRYVDLARERGVHLSLLQGFVQGAEPVIGAAAREGYLEIWRFLREEAGFDVDRARDFLGRGMLLSVLLAVDLPVLDATSPEAHELLVAACGPKLPLVLDAAS
ncbi:TetR/AcrR family transcriptional regulator [Amnibacterium setariae]|uniref:TetR/AcrR family transcriptional regulator n=1 Tax=Amnibacterium setariae TaxID=2306585 RepID=A0A3A1U549_9MICO|nr:TetR/AcrR family transcriptional regulator [Amnibacterium setariae]RIX30148.1 TetR/AcrR family transcriptional regulator [Amnibacterium setariae]